MTSLQVLYRLGLAPRTGHVHSPWLITWSEKKPHNVRISVSVYTYSYIHG